MKPDHMDRYLQAYPDLLKWVNECRLCHARGTRPDLPKDLYHGTIATMGAQNLRRLFKPLELDEDGLCNVCRRILNHGIQQEED